MLSEIFSFLEKANTRTFLFIFLGLSIYTLYGDGDSIVDPLSINSLSLIIIIPFSFLLVALWVEMIDNFNVRLSESDMMSWGPVIGGTILAFCILTTLSYLSTTSTGLTFSLIAKKNFIRLCTLYLLGLDTISISR
jgi:hypothetical protein